MDEVKYKVAYAVWKDGTFSPITIKVTAVSPETARKKADQEINGRLSDGDTYDPQKGVVVYLDPSS